MERAQTTPGTALLSVSLLVALLSACTSSPDASDSDQNAIEAPAATTSTPSATAINNTEAAMVTAARRQLEARLGLEEGTATIRTESFARVVWPNGAIGCPKPGRSYTMALVPGYQVVLEAGGRLYHYHGREGQAPFYCARPQGQGGWEMDR